MMNRRTFIKGSIAAGVLLTTPLEALCGVLRPKYMTATDMLRNERKFIRRMPFKSANHGSLVWSAKGNIPEMVMDNYRKAKAIRAKAH